MRRTAGLLVCTTDAGQAFLCPHSCPLQSSSFPSGPAPSILQALHPCCGCGYGLFSGPRSFHPFTNSFHTWLHYCCLIQGWRTHVSMPKATQPCPTQVDIPNQGWFSLTPFIWVKSCNPRLCCKERLVSLFFFSFLGKEKVLKPISTHFPQREQVSAAGNSWNTHAVLGFLQRAGLWFKVNLIFYEIQTLILQIQQSR